MVRAKQEAERTRLDGCEPNSWVLSLLEKLQPGQLGEHGGQTQTCTMKHSGVRGFRKRESGVGVKALKEQDRGWCPGAVA